MLVWDNRRAAPIGLFEQGFNDNAATRLASPAELEPRADSLLRILHHFAGNDVLGSLLFLAGLTAVLVYDAPALAGWLA